jgi:membrane protein DedA with SNARE-associated domain/rhodanese-related sulfurtransferase
MTPPSQLTYAGVLIAVLANQLCLPVPGILFLMAAGALSAHGHMQTSLVVVLSVLPCLAADGIWFLLGRQWGSQTMRLLCRFSADPRTCSRNAHEKFGRYGLPLLCVAKFLPGLDAVIPPLAGAEGVSPAGFFALDAVGSFLWSAFYVGVGYIFSNQLEIAAGWAKHFGTAAGLAIGVPCCLYAGWRGLILILMIRRLDVRRVSPAMLQRKLRSGSKVAVLDLLDFEDETGMESPQAIPGAFRIDPSRLRSSPQIFVPDDVEIVLYCSSQSGIVSAQAALELKRIGVENVWVLEGGLHGWREKGLPLSQFPEAPEAVAERLGVSLPDTQSTPAAGSFPINSSILKG